MRITWLAAVSTLIAWAAWGQNQGAATDFNDVEFEYYGEMRGVIGTAPMERISGGFAMIFIAENPEDNVRVVGQQAEIAWPEAAAADGGSTPDRILIEGDVVVEHPMMTIASDLADWNFATSVIVFTGNVEVDSADFIQDHAVDRCELNLETMEYTTQGGRGGRFALRGAQREDLEVLKFAAEDILDWTALISAIKTQGTAETASPGKRILEFLPEGVRNGLLNTSVDTLVQEANRPMILGQLNDVLEKPDFYAADAWAGVTLPDAANEMIAKREDGLTDRETLVLNRLLLTAAYGDSVAPLTADELGLEEPAQ